MAQTPLAITGLVYDDVTNRIIVSFREIPPVGHPDPVNFIPQVFLQVELRPEAAFREVRVREKDIKGDWKDTLKEKISLAIPAATASKAEEIIFPRA